jgi:pimeloyl-ACP methyl ester carboxylesterase
LTGELFFTEDAALPHLTTDDGVRLYYEEAGTGLPVVFVHEFAGDHRSYETQIRYFSRQYRCIAYNARGYPPSDVPEDFTRYSQDRARDDILAVLDGLKLERAHVAGAAESYAVGPSRVQLQNKDPRGWAEFKAQLMEHSARGSANTMRGVQKRRPSLYDLVDQMKRLTVPTLIMTGDEDEACLETGLLMKRNIQSAALVMLPRTGHAVNLEEPALFNLFCENFFHQVEAGRWTMRDPRSVTGRIL